jgi:hypothetical protein
VRNWSSKSSAGTARELPGVDRLSKTKSGETFTVHFILVGSGGDDRNDLRRKSPLRATRPSIAEEIQTLPPVPIIAVMFR